MAPLKYIKDKKELVVSAPTPGVDFEYPSTFFSSGGKPQLIIKVVFDSLEKARDAFYESLRQSKPNLDAGKEFVYRYLDTLKLTNVGDWESYGVKIAGDTEEISVWKLFEVTEKRGDASSDIQTGQRVGPGADLALLVLFCGIYRMGAIFDQGYLGQVSDRIMSQAVGLPSEIPRPDALIPLVGEWLADVNYLKMIAGIDMFLHRFPKALFSQARIGTIASRYRDCASLLSIRFFLHIIGTEDIDSAPAWISFEPVALNLIRMCKTGEEAGRGDSYFPYQSDMGLVKKSAYSTIINPSYFFFVHGVGALLGLEKSRNARMNLEYGVPGTVKNVFWVAYVHKRNHTQTLQFTPSGEQITIPGQSTDTEMDGFTLRSNSAVKWARFMESRGWTLTDFMRDTIRKMQQELIEGIEDEKLSPQGYLTPQANSLCLHQGSQHPKGIPSLYHENQDMISNFVLSLPFIIHETNNCIPSSIIIKM